MGAHSRRRVHLALARISCTAILLPAIAFPCPLRAGPEVPRAQKHEFRHEIDQMEAAWSSAILKANSAALEGLLADDYTGISAKGALQTKEQAINSLRTGAFRVSTLSTSDKKIRIYGSTAVVTSQAELTAGKDNQEMTGHYRYTRVYVRNSQGEWKIVSFEASRIQDFAEHK